MQKEGVSEMVFEKLCEIISEQLGVDSSTITMDTAFVEDLDMDSLGMVELVMAIEEEFDVGEIDEETTAKIKTVGDVVDLIGE
jgi:acyl carrier protein